MSALGLLLLGAISGSFLLFGQSKASAPSSGAVSVASVQEFPVTMRQNVKAGRTPVGTKVEAKLTMATLVSGTVIPAGAIFSGKVVESAAKSSSDPSRIAIRMDSVQWKNESKPITVYLTSWYYPIQMPEDLDHDRDDCQSPGGMGMKCPLGAGMPGTRFPPDELPPPPGAQVSTSRVEMKDVESARKADGTIELTSTHSNIKLDKTTTYVLATGDLTVGK
ncbi:MAG: hypothetical protein WA609_10270 [Terriglobales bacterium]